MNINIVNDNTIKISLTDDEVTSIFGGYDNINYNNPTSKGAMNSLLNSVITKENFILNSERLLIEVEQGLSGCIITLTKIHKNSTKRYRHTALNGIVLIYNSVNSMLDGITQLFKSNLSIYKSDLFRINNEYRLIIYCNVSHSHIAEYSTLTSSEKLFISQTQEYGTPLYIGNAVKHLGQIFN